MTQYTVQPISQIDAALIDGMKVDGFTHAVMRARLTDGKVQPWSFHKNEKSAIAAVRRNKSRDVVTR